MVTVGDMYAHRSGLPDHAGDDLEDLGYDRRDVLERLRACRSTRSGQLRLHQLRADRGAEAVAGARASRGRTSADEVSTGRSA